MAEPPSKRPKLIPWRELSKQEGYSSTCTFEFPSGSNFRDQMRSTYISRTLSAGANEGLLHDIVTFGELMRSSSRSRSSQHWEDGFKFARLAIAESECGSWEATLAAPVGLGLYPKAYETGYQPHVVLFTTYLGLSESEDSTSVTRLQTEVTASFGPGGREWQPLRFLDNSGDPSASFVTSTDKVFAKTESIGFDFKDGRKTNFAVFNKDGIIYAVHDMLNRDTDSPFTVRLTFSTTRTTSRRFPLARLSSIPLHHLSDELDLRSLLRLAQAVPSLRSTLSLVPSIRMRNALSPYFSDIKGFAKVIDLAGGLVGGSTILSVLMKKEAWKPRDLDLVVPWVGYTIVEKFLLAEGYDLDKESTSRQGYSFGGITLLHLPFRKGRMADGSPEACIDVCRLRGNVSPVDFVLSYHSTPPMNYFDGHSVVCLFPDLTFSYLLRRNTCSPAAGNHALGVGKYVQRGYLEEAEDMQTYMGVDDGSAQPTWQNLRATWRAEITL